MKNDRKTWVSQRKEGADLAAASVLSMTAYAGVGHVATCVDDLGTFSARDSVAMGGVA